MPSEARICWVILERLGSYVAVIVLFVRSGYPSPFVHILIVQSLQESIRVPHIYGKGWTLVYNFELDCSTVDLRLSKVTRDCPTV